MLRCNFALHDQVDAFRTTVRNVEEFGENLGGEPERRVCDNPERCPRQAQVTEVYFDDAGIAMCAPALNTPAQACRPSRVAFNCPYLDAGVEQRTRKRTRAGAELDDKFACAKLERTNEPFDDLLINEKILTEFATPGVALGWESPGHGPSPSSSCRHRSDRPRSETPTFRLWLQSMTDGSGPQVERRG